MIETDLVPGRRGATRAAYDSDNPMLLVKAIWDGDPRADVMTLQDRVIKELDSLPQSMTEAFIRYATANLIARIKASEARRPPSPSEKAEREAAYREKEAHTEKIASELRESRRYAYLLEVVAPNGKPLGDCTGFELSQFSGFYKTLGRGVGPAQMLRAVKTGEDIKAAMTWEAND
jgi:hypothetical protein